MKNIKLINALIDVKQDFFLMMTEETREIQ